jgi:hypothetical protein
LGLLLSNKPTVLPLRSAKRGSAAIRSDDVRAFPSGLNTIICFPLVEFVKLSNLFSISFIILTTLIGILTGCLMLILDDDY